MEKLNLRGGTALVLGIARAVGAKPADGTWRDEWVEGWMERNRLNSESYPRSNYEAGGVMSIEAVIKINPAGIQWMVDNGWPRPSFHTPN